MDASTLDNEWEEQDFETAEARREAAAALHDAAHLALLALSDGTSIPRTRASLLAVVAGDDPPGGDGDVVASSPPPPPPPPPALGGRRVLSLDEPLRVVLDGGWERRKGRGRRRSVRRRGKWVELHDADQRSYSGAGRLRCCTPVRRGAATASCLELLCQAVASRRWRSVPVVTGTSQLSQHQCGREGKRAPARPAPFKESQFFQAGLPALVSLRPCSAVCF
ncbi:hypothetical protein I4F81_009965 [Pyropia yezoensis]|uniref:Uncharacterized protein n=1 Tax=Pyropia yezoensis TaxID=2788 RepID=A0ACC3CBB1_PYRYE|nr:hypothetical protein I4F81_009965 [Neopyropia yezoensis]